MKDLHRCSLSLVYATDWTKEDGGDDHDAWLGQTTDAILAKMDAKAVAQNPPPAQHAKDTPTAQESRPMTEVVHANSSPPNHDEQPTTVFSLAKPPCRQKVMGELGKTPTRPPWRHAPPSNQTRRRPTQPNCLPPQPTPPDPCALPEAFPARVNSHVQKNRVQKCPQLSRWAWNAETVSFLRIRIWRG